MRWAIVLLGVVATFWVALLAGRWLPFPAPEDDGVRWDIALGLAGAVCVVAVVPMIRWADKKPDVTEET